MDKRYLKQLIHEINLMATEEIKIMEVCGSHTQMISKLGLRSLLSPKIKLLSGPGCPVCVTEETYIDDAIEMLNRYCVTIATFGDLIRVRGTESSLQEEKGKGKGNDVVVIYSPLDLIQMAERDRDKNIVFLGVGFETTAPIIALTIKMAVERRLKNLFFLTSIKMMQPIIEFILKQPNNHIQGLICPGHVATIKGSNYFRFLDITYGVPSVVAGFEALDIVVAIHTLVKQITQREKLEFKNLYEKWVRPKGNPTANKLMEDVFTVCCGNWRGIGLVEGSALSINEKYQYFDAKNRFRVEDKPRRVITKSKCECRDILLGNKTPKECLLFDQYCNPLKPYGPCMISTEGACAIAYQYREET